MVIWINEILKAYPIDNKDIRISLKVFNPIYYEDSVVINWRICKVKKYLKKDIESIFWPLPTKDSY